MTLSSLVFMAESGEGGESASGAEGGESNASKHSESSDISDLELYVLDVDSTIVDAHEARVKAVESVVHDYNQEKGKHIEYGRGIVDSHRHETHEKLFETLGVEKSLIAWTVERYCNTIKQFSSHIRVFEGVVEFVHWAKSHGKKLAILSNNYRAHIEACLDVVVKEYNAKFGGHETTKRLFGVIIGYKEGYTQKPSPEGLLAIAQMSGVVPSRALYVGDRFDDVLASRAAGMVSVLLNTTGTYSVDHPHLRPTYEFGQFGDFWGAVKNSSTKHGMRLGNDMMEKICVPSYTVFSTFGFHAKTL